MFTLQSSSWHADSEQIKAEPSTPRWVGHLTAGSIPDQWSLNNKEEMISTKPAGAYSTVQYGVCVNNKSMAHFQLSEVDKQVAMATNNITIFVRLD